MQNRKEIALEFQRLLIAGETREAFQKFVSTNFKHHNPYFKGDRQSLLTAMEEDNGRFPNKFFQVQRALEDGDLVAIHSRIRLKEDMPEIAVVHIFRFDENNMIVEEWDLGQQVPEQLPNENGMF